MKMNTLFRMCLILACVALASCAKNELTLTLAMYDHDPRAQIPLTAKQTSKLLLELEDVEADSAALLEAQKEHAKALFDFAKTYVSELTPITFGDLAKANNKTTDAIDDKVKEYDGYYQAHLEKLDDLHGNLKRAVITARDQIIEYVDIRNKLANLELGNDDNKDSINQTKSSLIAQRTRITSALGEVTIASLEQSRPLNTDFNKLVNPSYLVMDIQGVENLLAEKTDADDEAGNLMRLLGSLNKLLDTIELHSKHVAKNTSVLKAQLASAQQSLDSPGASLANSAKLIAKAATSTPTELKFSDRGAAALNSLVRSTDLFFSQIDRLQDPADPVLRIITNPDNEKNWNTDPEFSKTYFYAQGDSSVVIVRDAPNSYRVQRGDNDPSALVQSQLIVSRAVGDAAITIAGGAAGLDLPTFGAGAEDKKNTPLSPTDHTKADTFAEQRAQAKAQADMMKRVTSAFRAELQIFRQALEAAGSSAERDALIRELIGKLASYKTFYEEGN